MTTDLLKIIIMPLTLLIFGAWLKQIADKHEKRARLNDRIIEKRVAVYEAIGTDLNAVYVFLMQVGHWKELSPAEVLEKKRHIDKIMHINKPYWSLAVFTAFEAFMNTGFETYTGVGEDAKLRLKTDHFKQLPQWQAPWQSCFTDNAANISPKTEIKARYQTLMQALSADFGHYSTD